MSTGLGLIISLGSVYRFGRCYFGRRHPHAFLRYFEFHSDRLVIGDTAALESLPPSYSSFRQLWISHTRLTFMSAVVRWTAALGRSVRRYIVQCWCRGRLEFPSPPPSAALPVHISVMGRPGGLGLRKAAEGGTAPAGGPAPALSCRRALLHADQAVVTRRWGSEPRSSGDAAPPPRLRCLTD